MAPVVDEPAGSLRRRRVLHVAATSVAAATLPGGCAAISQTATRDWLNAPRRSADWVRGSEVVLTRYTGSDIPSALAWRDDSRRLAVRTGSGHGLLLEPQAGRVLARLPPPQNIGTSHGVAFVPGSSLLALGGPLLGQPAPSQIALTLVDSDTAELRKQIEGVIPLYGPPGLAAKRHGIGYSPLANTPRRILLDRTTKRLLVVPYDGIAGLESFDFKTWHTQVISLATRCDIWTAISPDGQWVATNVGLSHIALMARRTGKVVKRFQDGAGDGGDLAFSHDGRFLAATIRGRIPLGAPKLRLIGFPSLDERLIGGGLPPCLCVSFHPGGDLMAVGNDEDVAFCNPLSGEVMRRQKLPLRLISSISFSPDGAMLAVANADGVSILAP